MASSIYSPLQKETLIAFSIQYQKIDHGMFSLLTMPCRSCGLGLTVFQHNLGWLGRFDTANALTMRRSRDFYASDRYLLFQLCDLFDQQLEFQLSANFF